MKQLIIILLTLPVIGFSQVKKLDNDSAWTFTRIVEMDSISQLKLFARANEYFVKEGFNKSKSFIHENLTGKLETQAVIFSDANGATICKVLFIAKDNKYKFTLSNFYHDMAGDLSQERSGKVMMGLRFTKKQWKNIKDYAILFKNAQLEDFVRYMNGVKSEADF